MTPHHRERVLHGTVASEHVVQLFDDADSRAEGVAAYLHEGWARGDRLLVVARARHWAKTASKLEADGCPVAEITDSGQLIVLDAATTLRAVLVDGSPDQARFDRHVASRVARLCEESPTGVTGYGEMVDLLAERGDLRAAEELEHLWNALGQRCSFRLLCGYAAAHFSDERIGRHLQAICRAHTSSRAAETDLLASWLLNDRRPKYHIEGK